MKILALVGVGLVGAYLVFASSSKAPGNLKPGAGPGQAASRSSNVTAYPAGQIVTSIAQLGSSIFRGAGTSSPVDPTIRSAGATGAMIVSGAANDPTRSTVPSASAIITQLDEYNPNDLAPIVAAPGGPSSAPSDFGFIFDYN